MEQVSGLEISRESIHIEVEIGQGEFGVVMRGIATDLTDDDTPLPVAVKVMKTQQYASAKNDFVREALRLRDLDHCNVVRLLGVCLTAEPYYLVLEYLSNGDLKMMLRRYQESNVELSSHHLVKLALDVFAGFEYLQNKRFLHRDLAARNVFVSGIFVAKIGDFGLLGLFVVFSVNLFLKKC